MTYLELLRPTEKKSWAGQQMQRFSAAASGLISGPISGSLARDRFQIQWLSPKVANNWCKAGSQNVGGNDPGFGRGRPPKTLCARFACCGGRSRPRVKNWSGEVSGQGRS
jgi:hypothetical protein